MTNRFNDIIEQSIPGFNGLTSSASSVIGNLLGGQPSTAPARNKAAYFGVRSGMPGSGVSNALGYDLYGQDAEQYKQRGIDDLLKMLTTYSGTAAPTPGQTMQNDQFNQEFALNKTKNAQAGALAINAQQQAANKSSVPNGTYRIPGVDYGGVPGGYNKPYYPGSF